MLTETLESLYEHIEEKEVKESIQMLMFNCKMFDYKVDFHHKPLSYFSIEIITSNREHKMVLNFEVNVQKKYLNKIALIHDYDKQQYWYDKHEIVSSGVTYDFTSPLNRALEIVMNA